MYKYQVNLESCLDSSHLLKYENFRKQDYSFDRYVALNFTKYSNLNVNTKYNHIVAASLSSGISGLTLILQNAGLGTVAIEAFVAAVTTLTSVVSTSWIPVTGGSLAIALAAGALIGLTVIIVQNWDNIKSSMDDIKNWFLNQFSSFASLIRNFFSDVGTKGDKSKVVGREKIGDKEITRTEIIIKSDSDASFVEQSRKNPNIVFLMRQIKKYYYENENFYYAKYWGWDGIVDQDFVKKYNIYDLGISTYVFFKNTAFDLISNGTILIKNNMVNDLGYPYKVIQHDFDEDEYLENGFRHYHVYEYKSKNNVYDYYKINGMSINKSHSLFGELLWKNNK